VIPCTPRALPPHLQHAAAAQAVRVNPANAPPRGALAAVTTLLEAETPPVLLPEHLAVLVGRFWGAGGVHLTVGFLEEPPADLRDRILAHANAWGACCNARFVWTRTDPQVRITREPGGYWSYLGTDVLQIPPNEATMCLEGFTMQTPAAEFYRVVRHEFGHTLGFPHEHLRRELVAKIDRAKAIAYFGRTQGWSEQEVVQQVLTPLEESSIRGTPGADSTSIMCYQLPGEVTTDGQPIPGGTNIDATDGAFAAKVYPLAVLPPPPPPSVDVVAQIDAVFVALESKYAGNFAYLLALQVAQGLVDAYLRQHPPPVGISARTVVDAAFEWAVAQSRHAATRALLRLAQTLVDGYLG
jgi:hypothetical protein